METKFQTSFIPRKPLIPNSPASPAPTSHSSGLLVLISMVIFAASIGGAVLVFSWEKVELKLIEKNKAQLELNKKQFGSDIDFLKRFNTKINLTKGLVDDHIAVSNVFDIISDLVVDNVRFEDFSFSLPNDPKNEDIIVKMKGQASSFQALAYQSDVLGINKTIKRPVISDLNQNEKGYVNFSFEVTIPREEILYSKAFNTPKPNE